MKIKRKTFVGGLLATLCACATVITGLSFAGGNTVAAADTPVKQSAAYLNLDGGTNILNGFEGAQKENVYFGANNGSPVKWRVLSKGTDNKYSAGNMLLWADKQISVEQFNVYHLNPDYGFWGTSRMRASLNGGEYYTSSSQIGNLPADPDILNSISETNSWYGKLFSVNEQKAVVAASSYTTDCFGFDATWTGTDWMLKKEGITVNADEINGKYNINRINQDHPTSAGASYATSNGTVKETGQGDKLFLLDYYDINNPNYGFSDGGVVYAKMVNNAWTESSDWYPSVYAGNGRNQNSIAATYLKFTDTNEHYWLRQTGRIEVYGTSALTVNKNGNVISWYLSNSHGIRPAFNLDTTKIVYANSKSVSVGSTFTDVASNSSVTTPEYKLYVKSADYNTYSSKAISTMRVEGGNLKIIYNNPASVESGNIVVLLTDKNSTDGAVAYQATATLSSTASASKSAVASFSLSGIDYSQYDTTVLLTSANGGNYAETVYCSYNMEGNVTVPSDVENLTYDGTCKWVGSLSTKPDWYDENLHNNENVMTVSEISYKSMAKDATFTPLTAEAGKKLTDLIVDAGEYEITMTLDNGLKWAGSNTTGGDKKFKIKIGQKPSSVTPVYAAAPTYLPDTLPAISLSADSTKGNIAWDDEQKIEVGNKSYTWTFTPTDTNNYTEETGSKSFNFEARVVDTVTIKSFNTNGATVYTNTLDTVLKTYLTVEIKYVSFDETITLDPGDYELQINSNNKLKAGANKLKVKYGTVWSDDFPISGVVELSYKSITNIVLSDDTFTYPVTASEILSKITSVDVKMNDNSSDSLTADQIAALMELDGDCDLTVGTKDVTFKIKDTDAETDYEITINQGTLTPTVTFEDLTVTYDGTAKKIEVTVTDLSEGFILTPVYTVTGSDTTYNAAGYTNAGTYNYSVSFTHTDKNYAQYTTPSTATLKIDKAKVTGIVFEDAVKPEITGTTYTLEATGVPAWVTVKYYYNGAEFTGASAAGEYEITAKFTHSDPNYEQIDDITKTLTISDKPPVAGADDIVVPPTISATYTGSPVDYKAQNVPEGVDVTYTIVKKDDASFSGTDIINAGEYTVTVSFDTGSAYVPIADKTCVVTVGKAKVDMSGVKFADDIVTGNGKPHKVEATNLPQGVTVEYEYKGKKQTTPFEFTEVDDYTVKAYFTYEDEDNYEAIKPVEVTLTISDAVVESISANVENGAKFDINGTLDDVKAKIKAEIHFNNGTKVDAKAEELTIDCATLRDGGLLEVGQQTITVTYNDGTQDFTTTVEIEVAKAKVALPVYNGSLKYTGDVVKPAASDFEGFDSALMMLVESKTVAGLNAGAYKAVFALKDSERYQWATATTLKKTVFAAVVYEQVVLEDYEAAVDWNLAKAKITATKANGKLPVFASESYTGSFAEVVGLKYYTDETCAEEVAADELAYSTKYFVKAELIDNANFELDETAVAFAKNAFEYTTPEKQLTVWEKVVKFLTINWLWIVIAVVALILLITLIALIVRAAKRKREREEQRRLEEKEEKKREQEEREERRREEREERMARLNQQQMMMPQMMPQMMQQQMPMQQAMPQQVQAQPAVAAGGSASELAEIKAEISALRAEQNLRDVSALKAEQQVTQTKIDLQFANLFSRLGVEQGVQNGLSVNWLEEMVDKAVQKALAKNEKAEAQVAKADGAAAQVPPDAVMTTVTTTKIDTTKKPVQSAAAPAPVRTVVRNIVAPMPVDDGRVFDVGGFYKPADPLTDNIDDVLGNEDKQD